METLTAGIADRRVRPGSVRTIEVAVVGSDGVERIVTEPMFDDAGPDAENLDFEGFAQLMGDAGFHPSTRWGDAEALEVARERCECGGELDARGFRREDPLCCRTFAVCTACGRVAFEY